MNNGSDAYGGLEIFAISNLLYEYETKRQNYELQYCIKCENVVLYMKGGILNLTMARNVILGMTPKNDYIFKRLFGEIGCEEITKDLLEAIMNVKIRKVILGKTTELLETGIGRKASRLDVRVDLEDGTKVDVEIQTHPNDNFIKRSEAYASKLYISDFKKGMKYKELNKVVIIFILNFEYMKDTKTYHPILKLEEQVEHKEKIDEKEIHFLELKKFRKIETTLDTKLEQWMAFLDYEDMEAVEMAIAKNEKIKEANERLKMITSEDVDAYLTYVMDEMDRLSDLDDAKNEGKREGEKKGKKEGKIEVARKMLKLGISSEVIFEATGITKEEQKML